MNPERITCNKCQKPVERTEWFTDPKDCSRVLRVFCHGETDEMRLTGMNFMDMMPDMVREIETGNGEAFAAQRVTVFLQGQFVSQPPVTPRIDFKP